MRARLDALGVDATSEQIYWTLLDDPDLDVAGLARHLGRSESEIHSALDTLADLTLLRDSRDRPGRWQPITPERGLQLLLRRQQDALEAHRQRIAAGETAIQELIAEYAEQRSPEPHRESEHLVGLDAIQARMEAIAHDARTDCRSIVPGGPIPAGMLEASRVLDTELLAGPARQWTLYQDSVRSDPATMAYGRWLVEHGGLVRTAPVLPPRMLIVDDRLALVALDPGNSGRGAVMVSAPGVVASLNALFDEIWDRAVPLGDQPSRDSRTGLSEFERELLKVLASGATDEVAARRLGVSLRTVRRRMEDLMGRLDAASRFEAGLKAGRRGWL